MEVAACTEEENGGRKKTKKVRRIMEDDGNNNTTTADKKVRKSRNRIYSRFRFYNIDSQMCILISRDDKRRFLPLFRATVIYGFINEYIRTWLEYVSEYGSFRCGDALLSGEAVPHLKSYVDVNYPPSKRKLLPLHLAAIYARPAVTELLLFYKARTDVKTYKMSYFGQIPLTIAVGRLCSKTEVREWRYGQSIYKLIIILCLPRMQYHLENIEVLAWHTKETEDVFLSYVRKGKIPELASLLMVARKKLSDPSLSDYATVGWLPSMPQFRRRVNPSVRHLFDVFEKVGDSIEAYVRQKRTKVTRDVAIAEAIILLEQSGLNLNSQDIDLTDMPWFQEELMEENNSNTKLKECKPQKDDGRMPHYNSSGHRWPMRNGWKMRKLIPSKVSYGQLLVQKKQGVKLLPGADTTSWMDHRIVKGLGSSLEHHSFPIRKPQATFPSKLFAGFSSKLMMLKWLLK